MLNNNNDIPHHDLDEGSRHKAISRDECRCYLSEQVFTYRAPDYEARHPIWPGEVGIELEMIPAIQADQRSLKLQGPSNSLAALLGHLATEQGWRTVREQSGDLDLLTLVKMDQHDQLSFEPGGQLEFSSRPYPCLSDAVRRLRSIQGHLDASLATLDASAVQIGINPWQTVDDIGLQMPKSRYVAMNDYYNRIGPYGQKMMRLTCTIQVCLDFGGDEQTLVRRYLAGQLLAPFATALFAYSPIVGGKDTGLKTYRSKIWRHIDPSHTGLVGLSEIIADSSRDACIESYERFALQADVIFVESLDFRTPAKGFTFGDWIDQGIDGVFPNLADWETHLSLLFPEVRPRGFLELRSIDSQARPWQIVPAGFYCGLLYDSANLEWLMEQLAPLHGKIGALLDVAEHGLADPTLQKMGKSLFERAIEGFKRLPPCFRGEGSEEAMEAFYHHFVSNSRVPADDLLDSVRGGAGDRCDLEHIRRLESKWVDLIKIVR